MLTADTARFPLMPEAEWSDFARDLLEHKTFPGPDGQPYHHYIAFARHPWFFDRWLKMTGTVVKHSRLNEREKLMVIMHTAWWTRCSFAWVQRDKDSDVRHNLNPALHSSPRDAGCTDTELADLARPAEEGSWSDDDRAILTAVEECGRQGGISTPTWQALRRTRSTEQLMDLATLIGLYFLTCLTINNFGVPNYPNDPAPPWDHVDNGSPAPTD